MGDNGRWRLDDCSRRGNGTGGESREDLGGRRAALPAPIQPAGQGLDTIRWGLREAAKHLQILPLDHRPIVMIAKISAAVPAKRPGEPGMAFKRRERLDELRRAVVVQPAIASEAVPLEN